MNVDAMTQKPRTLHIVLNVFLLIINSGIAFGVCSAYAFETLTFVKKIILIIPAVLLAAFMIIKEFKVQGLLKRVYLNLSIWVGFMLILLCWYAIW
jgi:hypothetical protein